SPSAKRPVSTISQYCSALIMWKSWIASVGKPKPDSLRLSSSCENLRQCSRMLMLPCWTRCMMSSNASDVYMGKKIAESGEQKAEEEVEACFDNWSYPL